jgi:hypothetical protein
MQGNQIDVARSTNVEEAEKKNAYKILVGKPTVVRILGRPRNV